jgi:4a-hydroxytetrahydrobiopterin dehydratase
MTDKPDLVGEKCVACRRDAPKVTPEEIAELKPLVPDWEIVDVDGVPRLSRTVKFPDFARALAFTNKVGALAEAADHHPEIRTAWGEVTVSWWTHKIRGLHRNDFIMAAKTDRLILDSPGTAI